jgi:hypothetical protein
MGVLTGGRRFPEAEPREKCRPLFTRTRSFVQLSSSIIREFLSGYCLNLGNCEALAAEPVSIVSKNAILQLIYLPEA